jgi:hypothetical protein
MNELDGIGDSVVSRKFLTEAKSSACRSISSLPLDTGEYTDSRDRATLRKYNSVFGRFPRSSLHC